MDARVVGPVWSCDRGSSWSSRGIIAVGPVDSRVLGSIGWSRLGPVAAWLVVAPSRCGPTGGAGGGGRLESPVRCSRVKGETSGRDGGALGRGAAAGAGGGSGGM
jgi:hypothetical protein